MRTLVAAALPALLVGCISFGEAPPDALLTLTATSAPAAGQDQSSAGARSIVVQVPATPQALAAARVPVQAGETSISYVKDAQWAEPPARLFARLVSDTLTARGRMVVLSPAQSIGDPTANLGGELRSFGLDATARTAVVVFDAVLTRAGSEAVEKRRFEASVPVAAIDAPSAGPALNQAANQVAMQITDWIAAAR